MHKGLIILLVRFNSWPRNTVGIELKMSFILLVLSTSLLGATISLPFSISSFIFWTVNKYFGLLKRTILPSGFGCNPSPMKISLLIGISPCLNRSCANIANLIAWIVFLKEFYNVKGKILSVKLLTIYYLLVMLMLSYEMDYKNMYSYIRDRSDVFHFHLSKSSQTAADWS